MSNSESLTHKAEHVERQTTKLRDVAEFNKQRNVENRAAKRKNSIHVLRTCYAAIGYGQTTKLSREPSPKRTP
jgi:hypothetical protein